MPLLADLYNHWGNSDCTCEVCDGIFVAIRNNLRDVRSIEELVSTSQISVEKRKKHRRTHNE